VLLSSRYVRDLATLVVAYGISINLVEVTWKSKLKAQVCLSMKHYLVQVTCKMYTS
jgi:ATP/ADP translocase